jgi:subtilisin family serine protease
MVRIPNIVCLPNRLIVHFSANTDRNGHGTHVSETADGALYGVPSVSFIDVKVLKDGGGRAYSDTSFFILKLRPLVARVF